MTGVGGGQGFVCWGGMVKRTITRAVLALTLTAGLQAGFGAPAQALDSSYAELFPGCATLRSCAYSIVDYYAVGQTIGCGDDGCSIRYTTTVNGAEEAERHLWQHISPNSAEAEDALEGYRASLSDFVRDYAPWQTDDDYLRVEWYSLAVSRFEAKISEAQRWASGADAPPAPAGELKSFTKADEPVIVIADDGTRVNSVRVGQELAMSFEDWSPDIVSLHRASDISKSRNPLALDDSDSWQWLRNGEPIPGETEQGTHDYTIQAADIGKQISVRRMGWAPGYKVTSRTSQAVVVVEGTLFAKTYAPTISGTAKVGKTLTASVRSWSPKTTSRSWQWLRGGVAIAGATSYKYKLVAADARHKISIRVTGTRSGYAVTVKTSKATGAVALGTLAKGKVKVTGTNRVGKTLTAKTWKWSRGVTYHYQWYSNSASIMGATNKTYLLTVAEKGKRLKVKVWTTKDGYKQSGSRTSVKTGKIKG